MQINGVFQGGGVKGISLAGAVRAAETYGAKFHQVAGTSSGSIIASMIAAGYKAEEMRELILATSFSSFLKRSPIFNVALIGPALRVMLKKAFIQEKHWSIGSGIFFRTKGLLPSVICPKAS